MDTDQIIKSYTDRGYNRVIEKHDGPNFRYEGHFHPREVALHVLEGALDVQFDNQTHRVNPGENIMIDAERYHVTCIAETGCRYIHAEKEPGA